MLNNWGGGGIQWHSHNHIIYSVKFLFSYSTNFNLFFVHFQFNIVHLFLSLDLKIILILLTMFAQLTCLVYYIECEVYYTWSIQLMRSYASSLYNKLFILLIQLVIYVLMSSLLHFHNGLLCFSV